MALSITATTSNSITFSLSETNSTEVITLTDSASSSKAYSYGSSSDNIANAVSVTGLLSPGDSTQIDLYALDQTTFGTTQSIQFTGVKNFTVFNTSETEGYDFTVAATGSNSCTNLFNGGSGNLLVKPTSGFIYNDPFSGFVVSSGNRYVYLNDSGSGVTYSVLVFGLD